MLNYRLANKNEIPQLKNVLWQHGPNQWNYLTEQGVDDEMQLILNDKAIAIVATDKDQIIGFSVLIEGTSSPSYLEKYTDNPSFSFIGDVVVSSDYAGQGIATRLLNLCLQEAEKQDMKSVLIERHEENLASAGMMRKAGFTVIDTFFDPLKREAGSQNSVILEKKL